MARRATHVVLEENSDWVKLTARERPYSVAVFRWAGRVAEVRQIYAAAALCGTVAYANDESGQGRAPLTRSVAARICYQERSSTGTPSHLLRRPTQSDLARLCSFGIAGDDEGRRRITRLGRRLEGDRHKFALPRGE